MKHGLWLIAAVLLAYGSALPGGFVWLDHFEIERGGYRVAEAADVPKLLTYSLDRYLIRDRDQPEEMPGGYFRPVYALAISADWAVFGARAAAFHAVNLVWHALVVLGLWALGRRLFAGLHRGSAIAFAAALLFAVHPLGVTSVTWISGRKDVMCAAFLVAALLALFRAEDAGRGNAACGLGRARLLWCAVAALATVLAGLSKELGLLLPPLATALFWVRRVGPTRRPVRDEARDLAWVWAAALAVLAYRVLVVGLADLNAERPTDTLLGNLATSATLWWRYAAAIALPGTPRLSDAWPVAHAPGAADVTALVLAFAAGGAALFTVVRRGALAPALLWLGILAAPASGLVPLRHFHAERYLYPAYWGGLAALVIGLLHYRVVERLADRLLPARGLGEPERVARLGWALLAVVALATAAVTARSNVLWWSDEALFRDAVARDPHYVEGRLGLALRALQGGRLEESVALSQRAIAEGNDADRTAFWAPFVAHLNLGSALDGLRRREEALAAYGEALRFRPNDARVRCRAGRAALAVGRTAQARRQLERAAALAPPPFECALALATARAELGEWSASVALLEPLVRDEPRSLLARRALVRGLLELGRAQEAERHVRIVEDAVAARAEWWALRAWLHWLQGEPAPARDALARARQIDPEDALVRDVRARLPLSGEAP